MNCCEPEIKKEIPENTKTGEIYSAASGKNYLLPISILVSALIIAGAWVYTTGLKTSTNSQKASLSSKEESSVSNLEAKILPSEGVILPVKWGDLGLKLTNAGVIDKDKLAAIYSQRGGISNKDWELINSGSNDNLLITSGNSGFLLNLFWALGLSNKNEILEKGPMSDPQYGGAGSFASTAGWTLAKGEAMDYYSKYNFIDLSSDQQALVEKVSKGIYRPCCGNSTYFPDCNHGMAMLGLLELMASQGKSEEEMYQAALTVNSFWFPDNYKNIAKFAGTKGIQWNNVDPKEILGADFSSALGYRQILSQIQPVQGGKSNSCGI